MRPELPSLCVFVCVETEKENEKEFLKNWRFWLEWVDQAHLVVHFIPKPKVKISQKFAYFVWRENPTNIDTRNKFFLWMSSVKFFRFFEDLFVHIPPELFKFDNSVLKIFFLVISPLNL